VSRPKILVIEDCPADIALLRIAFDSQGQEYDLDVLHDGEEALRFIHEHRTGIRAPEPCVIVLDISLPKHDGMEVLKALRRDPALYHIHVVVWSSFANPKQAAEVEKFGVLHRTKPTKLQEAFDLGAEILALCKTPIPV
jgi:two-component system, response regulator